MDSENNVKANWENCIPSCSPFHPLYLRVETFPKSTFSYVLAANVWFMIQWKISIYKYYFLTTRNMIEFLLLRNIIMSAF